MSEALSLTQPQKAAAILVAMGKPSAGRLLKFFKQEELKALIDGARMLRTIPQAELEKMVAEFEAEFTEGAGLLDSAEGIDTILAESFSEEEVNVLMGRTDPPSARSQEIWTEIEDLEFPRLLDLLSGEHPQTVAVILTSISPRVAARVLVELEKPLRGQVVGRMATTSEMPRHAKKLIENRLFEALRSMRSGRDASAGLTRVASVLNELDKDQIEAIMDDLEQTGSSDIEAIRSRLFTFEEIILLTHKSRVALFDGMPSEMVTLALQNASAELVEAVLSAMGQRTRRMIESELAADADDVPEDEISRARKHIAGVAVQLAQRGSLKLPSSDEAA